LQLQRSYGNQAVQRLLAPSAIQAKLTVGAAHDRYEDEADRVADQVMRTSAGAGAIQRLADEESVQTKPLAESITPLVQREPRPDMAAEETRSLVRPGAHESSDGSFGVGSRFES